MCWSAGLKGFSADDIEIFSYFSQKTCFMGKKKYNQFVFCWFSQEIGKVKITIVIFVENSAQHFILPEKICLECRALSLGKIRKILYIYCPCVRAIWRFVHQGQVMLPEGLPEGNINCLGWTNRHITITQGQQLFYYNEFLQLQIQYEIPLLK